MTYSSMPNLLFQPQSFSLIGQRAINQDTIYPAPGQATVGDKLFLVCDGIGGADKGEEASRLLCESIVGYYRAVGGPLLDVVHLSLALEFANDAYQTYLADNPLVNRMGSTLALLQLDEQGVLIAHIGDSRVYQIRDGAIIFQTQDHKQVNDLVEAGIITAEQAQTHPWRNRLSRAVMGQAGETEPKKSTPDSQLLTDVRAGDYFFLCSDGALEQLDDYTLAQSLIGDMTDAAKLHTLLALCEGRVKDNYSGHLLHIQFVDAARSLVEASVNAASL